MGGAFQFELTMRAARYCASALRASLLMRSTIERNPFERCGVRCSRRPSRLNSSTASVARISLGVPARIGRQQDGDQALHDMGVAVADERQDRPVRAVRLHRGREPDLAGAALHLVPLVAVALVERRELAAELDHVAVAVVPFVEQREVVDDGVDIGSGGRRLCVASCRLYRREAPRKPRRWQAKSAVNAGR